MKEVLTMPCPKPLALLVVAALVLSAPTPGVAPPYIDPDRGQTPPQQELFGVCTLP
jgi:hypothetical protein